MFKSIRLFIADIIAPENKTRRNVLERLLNTDELTGLANKRAYEQIRAAAEADPNISFLVLDLDNFKLINDALGHIVGDKMLIAFAEILKAEIPKYGHPFTSRWGGDEFVLAGATAQMERLHAVLERVRIQVDIDDIKPELRYKASTYAVTVTGAVGNTFKFADDQIHERKGKRKTAHKAIAGKAQAAFSLAAA